MVCSSMHQEQERVEWNIISANWHVLKNLLYTITIACNYEVKLISATRRFILILVIQLHG